MDKKNNFKWALPYLLTASGLCLLLFVGGVLESSKKIIPNQSSTYQKTLTPHKVGKTKSYSEELNFKTGSQGSKWGTQSLDQNDSTLKKLEAFSIPLTTPQEWGEREIISGEVLELEGQQWQRRTILRFSNLENLVLSIEAFNNEAELMGKGYYNAEIVLIETSVKNHAEIVDKLNLESHREVLFEDLSDTNDIYSKKAGTIFMSAPSHSSGISGFMEYLNELCRYTANVRLVEQGEWIRKKEPFAPIP